VDCIVKRKKKGVVINFTVLRSTGVVSEIRERAGHVLTVTRRTAEIIRHRTLVAYSMFLSNWSLESGVVRVWYSIG